MTTNGGGTREKIKHLHEAAINAIARIAPGQSLEIEMALQTGKTLMIAYATVEFLRRRDRRVLIVSNVLSLTQGEEILVEHGVRPTLLRDQKEARAWLYDSSANDDSVILLADRLLGTAMIEDLTKRSFDLVIMNNVHQHRKDLVKLILARGQSSVVIYSTHNDPIREAQIETFGAGTHSIIRTTDASATGVIKYPDREIVYYHVADAERHLVDDSLRYVAELRSVPTSLVRRAAESSRAAFSAALLELQSRRVAPGAHRILNRPQREAAVDERGHIIPGRKIEDTAAESSLVPAWGTALPDAGDRIDGFLDRIDELNSDEKLATALSFINERVQRKQNVLILAQNYSTADYLREALLTQAPNISVENARKAAKQHGDQLSLFEEARVLIATDRDLPYLGTAPEEFLHMWFDPPSTQSHGYRRLDYAAPENKAIYAMMASPPFLSEERRLSYYGFVSS